jgi:hypothetical protein
MTNKINTANIKTAELAKELGAKSLKEVAEFYECTTNHLRNMHKRNAPAFCAMIIGYQYIKCDADHDLNQNS